MSRQPEKAFESNVNRHITLPVHHEAMGTGYSAGTPDRWYDGPARDLWVEFKFFKTIPLKVDMTKLLTPLQQRWLSRAFANGRNVAVCCGCSGAKGIIVFGDEWLTPITRDDYIKRMRSSKDLAAWITQFVCTP